MTVVDVGICDDVDELAGNHAHRLRDHHEEDRVLADVPVVRGEDVLAALVEQHV